MATGGEEVACGEKEHGALATLLMLVEKCAVPMRGRKNARATKPAPQSLRHKACAIKQLPPAHNIRLSLRHGIAVCQVLVSLSGPR
jgi:hypothetical protein